MVAVVNQSIKIELDERRTRPDKSEVGCLLADNSLARTVLGWEPAVTLEEGLKLTIEWMKNNIGRYRPDEYTV